MFDDLRGDPPGYMKARNSDLFPDWNGWHSGRELMNVRKLGKHSQRRPHQSFLLDPANPIWPHYEPFKWWLLPHGLAAACALVLAPMQFSDRLRARFAKVHRITERIYVTSAFVLAPIGAYIQYLDESQGASWTFTVGALILAGL